MEKNMFVKICLLFMFVTTNIFAQTASVNDTDPNVAGLPREKSEVLNSNWEVVPSLKTVHPKKFKGRRAEVQHENSDKVYVKRQRNTNTPLLQIESEDEAQVVYNPKRKRIGSISGAIILNLANSSDLNNILKDYPLSKIRLEGKIRVAIVKVKAGNDLATVVKNLKADKRIKNVEIEIVSNRIMPL
jgi:hypothetical protein